MLLRAVPHDIRMILFVAQVRDLEESGSAAWTKPDVPPKRK
jgi:hypothetical protein